MIEVVEGLDGAKRDRIRALREARRFFWVDVSASETRRSDLGEALGIPEPALQALLSFGDGHPSARRFYADGQHVASRSAAISSRTSSATGVTTAYRHSRCGWWSAASTC